MPLNDEHSTERSGVIERVAAVLAAFSVEMPRLSLGEAAERAQLSPSTTRRLLVQLTEAGLTRQDPETRAYSLGLKFVRLGAIALETADIVRTARSTMASLTEKFMEATFLGQLEPEGVVYLSVLQPPVAVRVSTRAGEVRPAHSTSIGKVLLAALSDTEMERWFASHELTPLTPASLATRQDLLANLEMVRELGYAQNYRESSSEFASVAAPVRDSEHRVIAALAISGPAYRIPRERIPELGAAVIEAANQITVEYGGNAPLRTPISQPRNL
jgi:DNA-binding IclR family transcriptional regulator